VTARVAISGMGVISPLAAGVDAFASALYRGARAAGEIVDFDPEPWLVSGFRPMDRTARLLSVAVHMALADARHDAAAGTEGDPGLGLVCGTMLGGIHSITRFDWDGITDGPDYVSPMGFSNTVINSAAGQAAIRFKLRGVNSTICAGLSSGLCAVGYASEFVASGRASALLAAGVDEWSEEARVGLDKAGALSASGCARPFAPDRDGIVQSEAAAVLLLEPAAQVLARGAATAVEVAGFGATHVGFVDGAGPTSDGAREAMRTALAAAGVSPSEVACLVTAGSGARDADVAEARALRQVFGAALPSIPACAPKAAFGEALGGSGALAAMTAALALSRRLLAPTPGHTTNDYGLSLSPAAQPVPGHHALVNAFGCDGHNVSLVLRRRDGAV
jgi:3-oxoacyl-[acyl-carrier-protein] synthase II